MLLNQRNLSGSNEQSEERMRFNQTLNQRLQSNFPSAAASQGAGYWEDHGQRSTFEAEPRGEDQIGRDNMPFGQKQVGNILGAKLTATQI